MLELLFVNPLGNLSMTERIIGLVFIAIGFVIIFKIEKRRRIREYLKNKKPD